MCKVSALNRTFPGRVARFADKIDESTRTMETEVDVPNPTLTLVPGMYAEVDLITDSSATTCCPCRSEAVDGSGDSARVFAVRPSGEIRDRARPARDGNRATGWRSGPAIAGRRRGGGRIAQRG